ncbi:MAG: protein translocase subunit SecF [Chloroflexi bacterium]|nr:protein translocase subunit SecF [Chloroflexota bacterium]
MHEYGGVEADHVLALAHDVFVILGLIAALQMEFDLILVAAILTTAGYSINDSIVIFDRMREMLRTMRRETLAEVLNVSINGTLSRTIITSMTTFFTVFTLMMIGGTVIHDFAVCLVLGIIVGTYSSVGICGSLVYQWTHRPVVPSTAEGAQKKATPQGDRPRGKRARRRRSA